MARLSIHFAFGMIALLAAALAAAQEPAIKEAPEEVTKQANDALAASKELPKAPAMLRALGKSAGANEKRRKVEAISTDTMMRLGELARAQEKICSAMQTGADKASANQPRAELVSELASTMRALLDETLAPLWSELSVKALRAGRFDFGSVHARFEAAALAHDRAVQACRGKPYAAGPDASVLAAADLRAQYEAAFEAGVKNALSQHKSAARAQEDLKLALSGFRADRRAPVEARLQAAIAASVQK